ncbi:hypothetical protein [Aquimarina sp. Aq107]|nr:hypothetical protein [Aquimarina sp. Aq107]
MTFAERKPIEKNNAHSNAFADFTNDYFKSSKTLNIKELKKA